MSSSDNTRGSIVPVLVMIIVVVLIGVLGYIGWQKFSGQNAETAKQAIPSTTAEVIVTQEDLEKAEKSLEELDFEDEDAAEAEQQANL